LRADDYLFFGRHDDIQVVGTRRTIADEPPSAGAPVSGRAGQQHLNAAANCFVSDVGHWH
jgi:hypothetical protein